MANPTWYVVRRKDGATLSSSRSREEATRMCAYLNEEEDLAVVSTRTGKGAMPLVIEQSKKRTKRALSLAG